MAKKQVNTRTRNYAFIVYEESATKDWVNILKSYHTEMLISPLHNKDVNPDGSLKKPHYHVLVMFSGVKSQEQAQEIRDAVGGVGWEKIASVRGYARYLCHKDNPEKAQYSESDVIEIAGADYRMITQRAGDNLIAVAEMMQFVNEHKVRYYSDFLIYCKDNRPDWFDVLVTKHTYVMTSYFKSLNAKLRDEDKGLIKITQSGYIDSNGQIYELKSDLVNSEQSETKCTIDKSDEVQ